MLTKDVSEELKSVLEGLQAQGKEPTVALVKARIITSVPMPALITTIKSWKSADRVPKVEVTDTRRAGLPVALANWKNKSLNLPLALPRLKLS